MKIIIMIFLKKCFFGGKSTILDPKMVHHHNSGLALSVFLNFG